MEDKRKTSLLLLAVRGPDSLHGHCFLLRNAHVFFLFQKIEQPAIFCHLIKAASCRQSRQLERKTFFGIGIAIFSRVS